MFVNYGTSSSFVRSSLSDRITGTLTLNYSELKVAMILKIVFFLPFFLQDEWMTCQRNWLYLESIFSAPDIQRQLPAEAKMFLTVDKSWKEVMRKVHRLPNALRAATQPGKFCLANHRHTCTCTVHDCLLSLFQT